jgi:catechol 2,3-dioxygenase
MTPATNAPLTIGKVTLTVHDLDAVTAFYRDAMGLAVLRTDAQGAALGVGETTLLELRRDPAARLRSAREAGLFHTAFLLPSRADLGRWTRHAAETKAPIVGAADHLVSEAIYLTDPEGNGVEIYADRPTSDWTWTNTLVAMASDPLDIESLVASGGQAAWNGFPPGSVVGHVHLQVGAIAPAEAFYVGVLGLDVTCHYPGATFYSSGGYHHHIATNIWNSRGASVRAYPSTGLADIEIRATAAPPQSLQDPWGTSITVISRSSM